MTTQPDRILGGVAFLVAVGIAVTARTFRVGFYTDPLGPGGLPYLVAGLLGGAGLALVLRPTQLVERSHDVPIAKHGIVIFGLIVYTVILPVTGFVLTTTAFVVVLATAFEGPVWKSAVLGAAYAGLLYLLFSGILGLPLPMGSLFVRGG